MPGFTTKFGIRKPLGTENIDEAELGLAFDRIDSVIPKVLGSRKIVTASPAITGETIITNSDVNFTVPIGRLLEVTLSGNISRTLANGTSILGIRLNPGGGFIYHLHFQPNVDNNAVSNQGTVLLENLAAATYGVYLTLRSVSGTGTTKLEAAGDMPTLLVVKDIGPVVY